MVGKIRDEKTGKYIANPDKGIPISVRVGTEQQQKLRTLLSDGETLSSKVRDIITLYLAQV